MRRVLLIFTFIILCQFAKAQQGFGTSNPAPSAVIDMVSGTKGALLPRVLLTSTTVAAPVIAPADALTVFNTNTAGDVTPGYYYWSTAGSKWVRLTTSTDIQEPWYNQTTNAGATANTQNIYQMGKVGINTTTPVGQFHVVNPTYALQSVFERTNTGLINGIAAGTTQFLYNTLGTSIASYTGIGIGKGAPYNGMSVGYNFAFKSNTDPIKDVAAINAGLVDYANGKGQLNFIVNGSGTTAPSMVLASTGYLGIGTAVATPTLAPTNALHVVAPTNPVRLEGLQAGLTTDNIVVVDNTGVLKTVAKSTFSADVRRIGTSHISEDAGIGSNGTTMPGSHNIAIGAGAMKNVSVGPSPFGLLGNIAIGGGDQLAKVTGPSNIAIGYGNNPNGTGGGNIGIGGLNLTSVTTGEGNYAIGIESQQAVTTGAQNISLGAGVLKASTGNKNIGMGNDVLTLLATGNDNVGFGVASGSALTSGNYNTFFGTEAGNRILGAATERYTSGDFSLFLGSQTKAQNAVSSQLNIQNYIYGVNGSLAFGDFTGANALITPTARLDVTQGNVRVRDINSVSGAATDKIVVADNTGVLKTVSSAVPKFFYAPSVVIPTHTSAGVVLSGTQTLNVYTLYAQQFGFSAGAGQARSDALSNLPVLPANQLDYFITYFDTNVFNTVTISTAGVISYTVKPTAVATEATFMNIVFKVKD
jgi:hypothetical protein